MKSHDEIANLLRKHGGDRRRIERHRQKKLNEVRLKTMFIYFHSYPNNPLIGQSDSQKVAAAATLFFNLKLY